MKKFKALALTVLMSLGMMTTTNFVNASNNESVSWVEHIQYTQDSSSLQWKILDWGLFSKDSQGNKLDCSKYEAKIKDKAAYESALKGTEALEVKGCMMEYKTDQIGSWFIFLAGVCLVALLIYKWVVMAVSSEGGSGGGMPGAGGGSPFEPLKMPFIGLVLLVLVYLWILNAIIQFIMFFADLFIK